MLIDYEKLLEVLNNLEKYPINKMEKLYYRTNKDNKIITVVVENEEYFK